MGTTSLLFPAITEAAWCALESRKGESWYVGTDHFVDHFEILSAIGGNWIIRGERLFPNRRARGQRGILGFHGPGPTDLQGSILFNRQIRRLLPTASDPLLAMVERSQSARHAASAVRTTAESRRAEIERAYAELRSKIRDPRYRNFLTGSLQKLYPEQRPKLPELNGRDPITRIARAVRAHLVQRALGRGFDERTVRDALKSMIPPRSRRAGN